MTESKKSAGKPIADVAHPGKSAPSNSSKPVIVTNRPIIKDPMVVEEAKKSNDAPAPKSSSWPAQKPKIEPLAPAEPAVEEAAATEEPAKTESDTASDADKESKDPPEATEAKPEAAGEPESKEAAEAPLGAGETKLDTLEGDKGQQAGVEDNAEAKKIAEHAAAIQKLTDSKQYYLPINSVEKRRTKRVVMLGIFLSLALILAWADIALDANLIHITGVKALTHFFST